MTAENVKGPEAFDISQFELEEVATLTVQNAAGTGDLLYNGAPVTIEVYGSGSRQAVQAAHRAGQAAQLRLHQVMRGKIDPKAAEKADEEMVEKLVACTRSVINFPIPGGARAIYENPKLGYITKQVVRFLEDDANFAKAPSTN